MSLSALPVFIPAKALIRDYGPKVLLVLPEETWAPESNDEAFTITQSSELLH